MSYTPIKLTEEELFSRLPEKIGQVSLNYDFYPGEDLYSDGDIENQLLNIVKNSAKVEYQSIIEKTKSWPILYHLSELRTNIVDFLPIDKSMKVLEIGSGCGAITSKLAEKAKQVDCVELSAKRSSINAYRNQECDNIMINVGNFADIEKNLPNDYDFVCLIGVYEYASSYIQSDHPYEDFLKIITKHAKPDGRVVIAIENKFGLKYFAGCKEDHVGEYFASLEGYPKGGSARTFTRNGLERIFDTVDIKDYHFYYPYPDYKLPTTVYSDKRLPQKGELTDNVRNLDRDRLQLFNEGYVFDSVIEDNEFPLFSNSYLVILGPDIDIDYVKYSNDRSSRYAIRTEIGKNHVKKVALNEEAKNHLRNLNSYYEKLSERYSGGNIAVNRCVYSEEEGSATFDFEKGITLETLMDEALFSNNTEEFERLFDDYVSRISYNNGVDISDYDLIFANIMVDGDKYTIIDYEWCVPKQLETKEIAFRALYCYVLEDERRESLNVDSLMKKIGVTNNEKEYYQNKELEFQKDVTGNHESIGEIVATIGTHSYNAIALAEQKSKDILKDRIQIYPDSGMGYSEDTSYYIPDVYVNENTISTDISFDGNIKALRIDPADNSCLVRIKELVINGENYLNHKKNIVTNGKCVKNNSYVFATNDPNINILLNDALIRGENVLHVDMEVISLSSEAAGDIADSIKKLF